MLVQVLAALAEGFQNFSLKVTYRLREKNTKRLTKFWHFTVPHFVHKITRFISIKISLTFLLMQMNALTRLLSRFVLSVASIIICLSTWKVNEYQKYLFVALFVSGLGLLSRVFSAESLAIRLLIFLKKMCIVMLYYIWAAAQIK